MSNAFRLFITLVYYVRVTRYDFLRNVWYGSKLDYPKLKVTCNSFDWTKFKISILTNFLENPGNPNITWFNVNKYRGVIFSRTEKSSCLHLNGSMLLQFHYRDARNENVSLVYVRYIRHRFKNTKNFMAHLQIKCCYDIPITCFWFKSMFK